MSVWYIITLVDHHSAIDDDLLKEIKHQMTTFMSKEEENRERNQATLYSREEMTTMMMAQEIL